jgi:hypothetical protein
MYLLMPFGTPMPVSDNCSPSSPPRLSLCCVGFGYLGDFRFLPGLSLFFGVLEVSHKGCAFSLSFRCWLCGMNQYNRLIAVKEMRRWSFRWIGFYDL